MIEVTRLNGVPMMVNSDLIKIAESSPDTMLTLIHGEKLIIRESCDEVLEKVLAYRASLLALVAERLRSHGDLGLVVALTSLERKDGPDDSTQSGLHGRQSLASKFGQPGNFDQVRQLAQPVQFSAGS